MGKASKRRRDAHSAEVAKYQRLAQEALAALRPRLAALVPPVVDSLPIADFSGRPEDLYVWYAFATREAQRRAEASELAERLRQLTVEQFKRFGYPERALDSLRLFFANREDIDAAGGSFYLYVK
jgi:hypothetical protein